jgi:hypothetical protein
MSAATEAKRLNLSPAMLQMLWRIAQHKYGWTPLYQRKETADALARRGLVEELDWTQHDPPVIGTDTGKGFCAAMWPVSPWVLGTYDHQPGGWTPPDGVAAEQLPNGHHEILAGVPRGSEERNA